MKLNLYLTLYMKVKRTWAEDSNVRPKTEKTEKKNQIIPVVLRNGF